MSKFSLFTCGVSGMTRIVITSLCPKNPKYDSSTEVSYPMSEKKETLVKGVEAYRSRETIN